MINEIYKNTIQNLSDTKRPFIQITEEKLLEIVNEFTNSLKSHHELNQKKELIKKYFFILSHTSITSNITHQSLINSFEIVKELKLETDYFIFLLSAIQKQLIDHQQKTGERIPAELYSKLKELLKSTNPEILEWTLRTIESLGPQSLVFQKEILKLRPSLLKLFNEHQKNTFMIIDLIKDNWKRYRK